MKFSDYDFGPPVRKMFGDTKKGYDATEKVYKNVVIPKILPEIGVTDLDISDPVALMLMARSDSKMAIDHVWLDDDKEKTPLDRVRFIQTRFRGKRYKKFGDFTIRYDNTNAKAYTGSAVDCEFFHFHADIFMYGICNNEMDSESVDKITDLEMYILLNLNIFKKLCKDGKIVPTEDLKDETGKKLYSSYVKDDILYCPILENKGDKDTRFIAISIEQASNLFPDLFMKKFGC